MIYNVIWNKTNREVARIDIDFVDDLQGDFKKNFPKEEFTFIPLFFADRVRICEEG
jgi:hypothetical protein